MAHLTEEEIRKIFKDEFESYYQRVFPTFVVSGGAPTAKHERSEYCMTTKSAQGVHFYEGGIAKIRANKNLEIYSGDDPDIGNGESTGEGGNSFKIECKNGRILIFAKSSDIELNGRNIMLKAQQNIYLEAGTNIKTRSGVDTTLIAGGDLMVDATKELFLNGGGAVGIHCESDYIHTTSGEDETMMPDLYDKWSGFHDETVPMLSKIDAFNSNDE